MSGLAIFTLVHVLISLVAIVTGFICVFAMIGSRVAAPWTTIFLVTTILTSATGFLFPFRGITPAVAFGILSSFVLALTLIALYRGNLKGVWRPVYVVGVVFALYLNSFVLVVQTFQKVPAVNAFAPTQTEPPFAIAQGVLLITMLILGFVSLRRFRPS